MRNLVKTDLLNPMHTCTLVCINKLKDKYSNRRECAVNILCVSNINAHVNLYAILCDHLSMVII